MTAQIEDETEREARLLDAQAKAEALFDQVAQLGLIRPGVLESSAGAGIRDLAADLLGVRRYWHKRIVRAGPNTLLPYRENPPDLTIGEDDIVCCDFGPIFEEWEADFGRTFVLGDDPVKNRLRDSLPVIFAAGRTFFDASPDVTGAELYAHVAKRSADAGWTFGGAHAGHRIGQFPHREDRRRPHRLLHRTRERRADAQAGPHPSALSLDPRSSPHRARRTVRWVPRRAPRLAPLTCHPSLSSRPTAPRSRVRHRCSVRTSLLRADDAAGHARNPYLAVFCVGGDSGDDSFRDPGPRRFVDLLERRDDQ